MTRINLCQMRRMIRETQRLLMRISTEEMRATGTPNGYSGMPRYRSGRSRVEESAVRIADLKEAYWDAMELLTEMRNILDPLIDGLEDPDERAIMRLRYMKGYSAEEIAESVYMTDRMVYYILRRVEKKFAFMFPDRVRGDDE